MESKIAKVHRLPTEDKTNIGLLDNRVGYLPDLRLNKDWSFVEKNWDNKHLHFTTEEVVEVGDWQVITTDTPNGDLKTSICKHTKEGIGGGKKIVGTSDRSLKLGICKDCQQDKDYRHNFIKCSCRLPQAPQYFIKQYAKLDGIDEVLIEYTNPSVISYKGENGLHKLPSKPKVNSHNEFTTHPIKNSWNREEVIDIFRKFANSEFRDSTDQEIHKWIKNNLLTINTHLK